MVRVTVEDCLKNIDNRFDLTLAATYRARQIANGSMPKVDLHGKHKPTVVALNEVAQGKVGREILNRGRA